MARHSSVASHFFIRLEAGFIGGGEAFDGVAVGGAGESGKILFQVGDKERFIALAHFAKHPPYGFMDEVVAMAKEFVGQEERGGKDVVAHKIKSGDDGYPLLPKIGTS